MAACPIVDQFLVVIYAEDRRVGYCGSDLRPYFPGVKVSTNISGLFGNQVCAGRLMAAEKNMQIIIFISPYDGAVVVIFAPGAKRDDLGEVPGKGIISDDHGLGRGLGAGPDSPPSIEGNVDLVIEINGLRPLPAIVKHLDLSALTKSHRKLSDDSLSLVFATRKNSEHDETS